MQFTVIYCSKFLLLQYSHMYIQAQNMYWLVSIWYRLVTQLPIWLYNYKGTLM
jgi:hypothetical protein